MKTIVFVRHAKSSWKHDVGDVNRPLKSRGFTDATLVADQFRDSGFQPDRIFSSPANRALSTCKIFLQKMEISDIKLDIIEELYDFGGHQVVNFISSLDDNYQNIMVFGHNHAFTSIVNSFGSQYIDNLPTSGLVMIRFDITLWQDLEQGVTELMIFPKDLR